MYRQLLHTADISPFDIIVLFFWQAQWARSIILAVLFLFHWVHTLTMVTFLNGSTCALPILYNNLQPILTSVTTSWATWALATTVIVNRYDPRRGRRLAMGLHITNL